MRGLCYRSGCSWSSPAPPGKAGGSVCQIFEILHALYRDHGANGPGRVQWVGLVTGLLVIGLLVTGGLVIGLLVIGGLVCGIDFLE